MNVQQLCTNVFAFYFMSKWIQINTDQCSAFKRNAILQEYIGVLVKQVYFRVKNKNFLLQKRRNRSTVIITIAVAETNIGIPLTRIKRRIAQPKTITRIVNTGNPRIVVKTPVKPVARTNRRQGPRKRGVRQQSQ